MTGKSVSVVLVHGGFVDGSGSQVQAELATDSFDVIVVQNPPYRSPRRGDHEARHCRRPAPCGSCEHS